MKTLLIITCYSSQLQTKMPWAIATAFFIYAGVYYCCTTLITPAPL